MCFRLRLKVAAPVLTSAFIRYATAATPTADKHSHKIGERQAVYTTG